MLFLKVHACIISYLRKQLPLLARGRAKESMIERLGEIFQRVAAKHKISISKFTTFKMVLTR